MNLNTWYHVAVTRDASGDIRFFWDGVLVSTHSGMGAAPFAGTSVFRLGAFSDGSSKRPFNGWIDNARILMGTALYTSTFTPPAAAFEDLTEVIDGLKCPDFDDRIYVVTAAGTTDAAQPVYDTVVGNPTTDGSVTLDAEQAWSRCIDVTVVDGSDPRKKFTVTELLPVSGGGTDGRDQFPDDSMNGGVVVWETGNNAGIAMEVRDYVSGDPSQDVELFLDLPFDIEVGDDARIYRGCFKRLTEDCKTIFDNVDNFRGEPYVPGQDALFRYPDAKA